MNCEFVNVTTADGLDLQGLIFAPGGGSPSTRSAHSGQTATTVAVWIHGLTSSFHSNYKRTITLAKVFNDTGIAYASFDNRGHDAVAFNKKWDNRRKKGYRSVTVGTVYEVFEDCVLDLDAIVDFLYERFKNVILIGHSTGANKVVYYLSRPGKQKKVKAVVLAGPVSDVPLTKKELGDRYEEALSHARQMIKSDKKFDLIPLELSKHLRTAQRFLSLSDQNSVEQLFPTKNFRGPLTLFRRIRIPTFVVIGQNDVYLDYKVEDHIQVFKKNSKSKKFSSFIVPDSDHSYSDHEEEFAQALTRWIRELQIA